MSEVAVRAHRMSDPKFQARSFTEEPAAFGRAHTLVWRTDADAALLDAAQLQHRLAVVIRDAAKRRFGSVGRYAEAIGQTPDRMAKVLRGEAVMRLEDIACARLYLGIVVTVTVPE